MPSVTLFIRKIPAGANSGELQEFVEAHFPWLWRIGLGKKARVIKTQILTMVDKSTKEIEYHGLAVVEPASAADELIARMNLKYFKGRRVNVRRYYVRSSRNERRKFQDEEETQTPKYVRLRDRRRENLEIMDDVSLEVMRLFNRQGI
jgi:hypothetical protein